MTKRPATIALALLPLAAPPQRQPPPPVRPATAGLTEALQGLEFRNIGPALMGGRIDDFAVVESRPSTFYVAAASGGIWKTVNGGVTFEPVFDEQEVSSIGDVTVAPSDPAVVYAGTGEPNNRQSSSWGNGVYRSRDGGRTWTNVGLRDTLHIGRLAVHPTNPEVVYVAALGHLWGPNRERGLFKTTDGGETWTNTKFIDEDAGFVDVAMDPQSPDTLYAASYQRRRTPFGFNGGGPGSGLWKTTDGGRSWTKLTNGLPAEGDVGRIGVTVYRRDPQVVYALVEHAQAGGIYRSDDGGSSWRRMSDTNPRPSYYSKVHVDPNNDQRVWVLGAQMYNSEDGGRTFRTDLVQKIHGDYHALWIDPADSNHVIAGSDGGVHVSRDRGRTWEFVNTLPLAQFYEVHYDMRQPYWVCGGLQDNGSWCGPSRTLFTQGIGNEDWFRVGGGDGFYTVVDPTDHNVIYVESQDGNLQRFDLRTNERRVLRPEAPEGERYRFNWNSPVLISPHDARTIYYGGNRLFGSGDRGETWSLVTPDLTAATARDALAIFGKTARDFLSRNDGVVHWGTITTLAESPLQAGVLWVGTDDGNVQVSRDGGQTWTNVAGRVPGLPRGTYVSRVEASRAGPGSAFVAFDGHRADDYTPYVFLTDDYGRSWRSVSANLPRGATVSVVREHPQSRDVLLLGTETGLWVSLDRGGQWHRLRGKLPTVPVDDVQVHPRDNDVLLGTHGRGVFILDDAAPLLQMAAAAGTADLHLFDPRSAVLFRVYGHKGNTGHQAFLAPNPPDGALLTYWLRLKLADADKVQIIVRDAAGSVVRELEGPKAIGLHRVAWDLRHEPPVKPDPNRPGEGFLGPPRGPLVIPGVYQVTVAAGTASVTRPVTVVEDARINLGESDRKAWLEATRAAARLWTRTDGAQQILDGLRKQLATLQESLKKQDSAPADVSAAVKALADKADALARRLSRQTPLGFAGAPLADEPEPLLARSRGLYLAFSAISSPPTAQHQALLARLGRDVDQVVAAVNEIVEKDVPALNRTMLAHGIGRLDTAKPLP